MQIGIDLGATKIEYVLLDNDNIELKRDRVQTPSVDSTSQAEPIMREKIVSRKDSC